MGYEFGVIVPDVDEPLDPKGDPAAQAAAFASAKAKRAVEMLSGFDPAIVIAADTVVWRDEVLGKPRDEADARRMLTLLGGGEHSVYTALCLTDSETGETHQAVERTIVVMDTLDEAFIHACIANGEPMDKAGAYAYQGMAAPYVKGIMGCYYNVVGLPLRRLRLLLSHFDGSGPTDE